VFTEESSRQLTPLSEEHADPPATAPAVAVPQHLTPESRAWWLPWLEVVKASVIWIVSVLLLLFVPVFVALPYMIYKIASSGAPSAEALQADKALIFFSVLGVLPAHLLTLLVTWMIVSEGRRHPFWKTVGFEWPQTTSRAMGTLLSIVLALALLGLAWLVTNLYGGNKTQLDLLIESSLAARFATAFVAVATAPLVEEVIYRGVLYSAIEKAAGTAISIVVVSLLFAGVHVFQYYNNLAVITVITLLSITLTVTRAVTGKVLPAFIIHLVFNGIQSIVLVLAPFIEKPS
jgi:membrane protease YdiL (CAAX protease family)